MLGFELDFWDYATFATVALAGLAGVLIYIWIAGLPGRIALARNHPEAEAVKIMGWAGSAADHPAVDPGLHLGVQAHRHRRHPALSEGRGQGARRGRESSEGSAGRSADKEAAESRFPSRCLAPPDHQTGRKARSEATMLLGFVLLFALRLHRLAGVFQVQVAEVHHPLGLLLDLLRAASRDHLSHRPALRRADIDRGAQSSSGRSSSRQGCRSLRSSPPCWSSRMSTSSAARRCSSSIGASTKPK